MKDQLPDPRRRGTDAARPATCSVRSAHDVRARSAQRHANPGLHQRMSQVFGYDLVSILGINGRPVVAAFEQRLLDSPPRDALCPMTNNPCRFRPYQKALRSINSAHSFEKVEAAKTDAIAVFVMVDQVLPSREGQRFEVPVVTRWARSLIRHMPI